jgi:hypothetical protein
MLIILKIVFLTSISFLNDFEIPNVENKGKVEVK